MDKTIEYFLFCTLGLLCALSLFTAGVLAGSLIKPSTQEQRIHQLEQRCDSLQRQIDFMVE